MTACLQCNTQNRLNAKFCTHCGFVLANNAVTGSFHIQPGQIMAGQYLVVRELGRGGMGAVYLATQTMANKQRQVVIKEMLDYYDPHDPQGESKARQRFEAEAGTLVTLNFGGIPQIFDYFSAGGHNYIVMQFIEGRNLQERLTYTRDDGTVITGQPYPIEQVVRWGIQVCKVLENLTMQQVVHMDIKPANLILDRSDDVWLVDFGTAKAQWGGQSSGQVGLQKSSVYGTIGYAPPEQVAGKARTRSDVYALAATLYHLLTDNDPRDNPFQFSELTKLPKKLAEILKAALAQDVTRRLTASQFRLHLTQFSTWELTSSQPPSAKPIPPKERNLLIWGGGIVIFLLTVILFWNLVISPSMNENATQEVAKTTEESTPVSEEPTPVSEEPTPVSEEPTPLSEEPTPTITAVSILPTSEPATTVVLLPDDALNHALLATVQIITPIGERRGAGEASLGSGSVLTTNGHILTNFHVIGDPETGQLYNRAGRILIAISPPSLKESPQVQYIAQVIQENQALDLALLKIVSMHNGSPLPDNLGLTTIPVGNFDTVQIGHELSIIGFPGLGGATVTFTRGTVAGFLTDTGENWIKTDAEINSGNSGGAAINRAGELIGIPSAAAAETIGPPGKIGLVRPVNLAQLLIDIALADN